MSTSIPAGFSEGVAIMKKGMGRIMRLSPQLFEAMNINLTWVLLRDL
jgi:hypothetical protein